jgi:hypothetical protein
VDIEIFYYVFFDIYECRYFKLAAYTFVCLSEETVCAFRFRRFSTEIENAGRKILKFGLESKLCNSLKITVNSPKM